MQGPEVGCGTVIAHELRDGLWSGEANFSDFPCLGDGAEGVARKDGPAVWEGPKLGAAEIRGFRVVVLHQLSFHVLACEVTDHVGAAVLVGEACHKQDVVVPVDRHGKIFASTVASSFEKVHVRGKIYYAIANGGVWNTGHSPTSPAEAPPRAAQSHGLLLLEVRPLVGKAQGVVRVKLQVESVG